MFIYLDIYPVRTNQIILWFDLRLSGHQSMRKPSFFILNFGNLFWMLPLFLPRLLFPSIHSIRSLFFEKKSTSWCPTWNFPTPTSSNVLLFFQNCPLGRTNSMRWRTILWKSRTIRPDLNGFFSLPESSTLTSPFSLRTPSPSTPASSS